MWPWEHVVVGYLVLSVASHAVRRRPPSGSEAVAVAVASILPDVVDKPLAWEFGLFPSGYGIAHSVFFAVPLASATVGVATLYDRGSVGVAFATGYLLHLSADVLPQYVLHGRLPITRLLWPVASPESSYPDGFTGTLVGYLEGSAAAVLSGPPSGYVVVVGGVTIACFLLWLYDGMPGLREPARYLANRHREWRG